MFCCSLIFFGGKMLKRIFISVVALNFLIASDNDTTLTFEATEGTLISVDVSPNGRTIAFDLLGHIYLMSINGGKAEALTKGSSWNMFPRFSPNGDKILFTSDRSGSDDLWIQDIKTGEMKNISNMNLPVHQGSWSVDGKHVFGTALNMKVRHPVYMFNMFGKKQQIIPAGSRAPVTHFTMHPNNGLVYFAHGDAPLYRSGDRIKTYDLNNGEIKTYIDRPGGAANPTLSKDGKSLAYIHRDDRETVLVIRNIQTNQEKIVNRDLDFDRMDSGSFYGSYTNMSWHPNGRDVLISYGGGIHSVNTVTGKSKEIKFAAKVKREIKGTVRFKVEVPQESSKTRSHRWSQQTPAGILYESLGDLYLKNGSKLKNLTESDDHETSPFYDPKSRKIYYASWNDRDMGSIFQMDLTGNKKKKITTVPSQYGSITVSGDGALYYIRGRGSLINGQRLEKQTDFELVSNIDGKETKLSTINWSGNRYAKRPPVIHVAGNGNIYYSDYVNDVLTIKSISDEGLNEKEIIRFPHATRAVISPDMQWVAFREYHRSYVTPFEFAGKTYSVSAEDGLGFSQRVDSQNDGDFMRWSKDSKRLLWTRGKYHYEKSLNAILDKKSKVTKTDLSIAYEVDNPGSVVVFKNVRVLTMNQDKDILEGVTILIRNNKIISVGDNVRIPKSAKVYDLEGRTIMPGMFDAHGHYGSPISALNVIEQNLYGLKANLAYGVTTMYDVYGTTQKDFWVSDMIRKGRIDGPRIFSVGDPIFVTKYRTKMYRPIKSLEDALEHVQFNKDHGATAVKDYSNHNRQARQHLVEASKQLGINVVSESFSNPQMNLTQIVDGFTGLEHTLGLEPIYEDVIQLLKSTDLGITPTFIVVYNGPSGETYFYQTERLWEDTKLLNFFRKDELLRLRRPGFYWPDDHYAAQMGKTMKKLYDRGITMQMGAHGNMMGLGAHWEMELFTHGSFSNYDAIEIATINGFKHHGLDHILGSIEPGKLADMVVMTKNPLENIRNTRSIEYVVKNGVIYSGRDASRVYPNPKQAEILYFKEK